MLALVIVMPVAALLALAMAVALLQMVSMMAAMAADGGRILIDLRVRARRKGHGDREDCE